MPNPHFDVKVISRNGQHRSRAKAVASAAYNAGSKVAALSAAAVMAASVVASAAYRSGEALYDMGVEKTYDYSHKDEIVHTEIVTPADAPPWAADRQFLWNMVERSEKRKDAQLARDIIAALPRELERNDQIELVRAFVREQFVAHGMVADFAVHDKVASDGGRQPHVHILLTLRDIDAAGFGKKNRAWNDRSLVTSWRHAWADTTNRFLAAAGRGERVDLSSYKEQGVDKIPGEHMGPDAWNLEEQGVETAKGDRNRKIDHDNALIEVTKHYVLPDTVPGDSVVDLGAEPVPGDGPLIAAAHDERADAESAASEPPDTATAETDEPLSDAQLQEIYRAHLRHSVQGMVRQSMQGATEQVVRLRDYARAVLEKTKALAHGVFDRYAARFMQQPPRDPDRER